MEETLFAAGTLLFVIITAMYSTRASARIEKSTRHTTDDGFITFKAKSVGRGTLRVREMGLVVFGVDAAGCTDDEFVDRVADKIERSGKIGFEFNLWEPGDDVAAGEELVVLEVRIPVAGNDISAVLGEIEKNTTLCLSYRSVLGIPGRTGFVGD